jgi:hypothetical protein
MMFYHSDSNSIMESYPLAEWIDRRWLSI